jgi:hypothetical protein
VQARKHHHHHHHQISRFECHPLQDHFITRLFAIVVKVTKLSFFLVCRGWTPRDGLYDIADQLIDPGLGLHGPIGIPELSTFDPENQTQFWFGFQCMQNNFVELGRIGLGFKVVSPLMYDECHGFRR